MPLKIAIAIPPEDAYVNYFEAIEALGAQMEKVNAGTSPDAYDGLLLPGGGDIHPKYYHQEIAGSVNIIDSLDTLQFGACENFVRAKKPVLGICRGHQLVNVFFGGSLIQHLPSAPRHAREKGSKEDRIHASTAAPDSWIGRLYGASYVTNSSHHQAVDVPGQGLVIDSYSDDGVAEALHHESLPVYAVQFHPERMCFSHRRDDTVDGSVLLRYFLDVCEAEKQARRDA